MGLLTKCFIPIDSGVFVGNPSKRVREQIFDKLSEVIDPGEFVIMVYPNKNSQGFSIKTAGTTRYEIICLDGLWLSKHKSSK